MLENNFNLQGKIALVTGASRGIGYALALELAKRGAHILAVARDKTNLENLDDTIRKLNGTATLIPLDLTQKDCALTLKNEIEKRWTHLDILILNAAIIGPLTPITHIKEQTLYKIFAINSFSQWALLSALDPLLQKSKSARILAMSSSVAQKPRAFWGAYAASKATLESFIKTYAAETTHLDLKINLVNPGATRTDMRAQAMPLEDPHTLPTPEDIAKSIIRLVNPNLTVTGKIFDYRKDQFV